MTDYQPLYTASHALVIGIDAYQDPRFMPLGQAERDAAALAEMLAVAPLDFTVQTLLGRAATKQAVLDALHELRKAQPDDRVLVYFAGHGYTLTDRFGKETGYLACADTVPDRDYTALELEEVMKLRRHLEAKHAVFIFDACFSGQALGLTRAPSVAADKFLVRRAYLVLSAGAGDQTVSDFRSMTTQLLALLKQAIAEGREVLTLNRLGLQVQQAMAADSQQMQIPQFGHLQGSQGGDVVLFVPPEATPLEQLPERVRTGLQDDNARVRYFALGEVERLLEDSEHTRNARTVLEQLVVDDPDAEVRRRAYEMLQTAAALSAPVNKTVEAPAVEAKPVPPSAKPADKPPSAEQGVPDKLTGIAIGQQLGPYRVVDLVSMGSTSVVFKAEQTALGRMVAIKVLATYFQQSQGFMERFSAEARALAQLQHPRIVPVFDFGEFDGKAFLVMGHMPGGSLASRLDQGPLPVDQVLTILEQVGEGLDFAHGQGIVHRDIRPTSILFDNTGWAYLSNFGLPSLMRYQEQLTGAAIAGTPAFMAPEIIQGEAPTRATDLYALGVLLYQMLAGELPYRGDTPMRIMMAQLTEPVPDIRQVQLELPEPVTEVLQQALAKEPDKRFASATAMAEALRQAIT